MNFHDQHRPHFVGGAFMPAAPIYRPMARRCAPQADKSAPTEGWMSLLMCIIGTYGGPDEFVNVH